MNATQAAFTGACVESFPARERRAEPCAQHRQRSASSPWPWRPSPPAAPAPAPGPRPAAPACSPGHALRHRLGVVTVSLDPNEGRHLALDGSNRLTVNGVVCGTATLLTTTRINIASADRSSPTDETVILDFSNGGFSPAAPPARAS